MSNELVDVATFGLAWEAHLAQSRLEEAGIEIPRGLIPPNEQKFIFQKLGWHDMA